MADEDDDHRPDYLYVPEDDVRLSKAAVEALLSGRVGYGAGAGMEGDPGNVRRMHAAHELARAGYAEQESFAAYMDVAATLYRLTEAGRRAAERIRTGRGLHAPKLKSPGDGPAGGPGPGVA